MARYRVDLKTGYEEAVDADDYSADGNYWRFWNQEGRTTVTVAHYNGDEVRSITKVADDWQPPAPM